ncbi:MAG TPA: regulatory protein RecX [Burkholderiaceae bacterium]|nr:regulatory protein RecX [Burkholderiaceae bacterium]
MATAVALLARRDFSRAELRGRLLRRAAPPGGPAEAHSTAPGLPAVARSAKAGDLAATVEQVLDQVQENGLLCERRFAEAFVRTRAARFGPARLRHELARRGIDPELIEAALLAHQADEFASALALWRKRFKSSAPDEKERARQARFLSGRGFSHEVIRRILKTAT